jgi:D-alanyl-lipoteichoic acid acyltransferase DltB (MBOAT superfamily)
MAFTSYTYLAFLLFAVPLVRAVRGATREWVLLGLSLIFYAAWDPRFLVVLLGLGIFTYWAGHAVARGKKKLALVLWPIAAIVLLLSVFKYTGMLIELVNVVVASTGRRLPIPKIILPLGISFFTFECISYLLDVYRGTKELMPLRRFLLFPAFWPHMVAGPILRIKELGPQLETPIDASASEMLAGADRIVIGLLKKMVVANSLAGLVDQGFAAERISAFDGWVLALAFGLQIYFDFSAYSDIAIGSARLVGFKFPENFNLPYHSTNPSEFWNRWHMTLSRWIRDYLFFPLNMKAGRRVWLRYASLVIVMTVVGLWHGAGLTFILWGTWHGLLMVGHRLVQPFVARSSERSQKLLGVAGWVVTMLLVQPAWVLFRAPTIGQAGGMLRTMFLLRGLRPAFTVNDYLLVLFGLAAYFALEPLWKRLFDRNLAQADHRGARFWLRPLAYAGAVQAIFMFDRSNVGFIYFQF